MDLSLETTGNRLEHLHVPNMFPVPAETFYEEDRIEGIGQFVKIDVSQFSKLKSNYGPLPLKQWVFGSICWEIKECFTVAVPNQTSIMFVNKIVEHIRDGSINFFRVGMATKLNN